MTINKAAYEAILAKAVESENTLDLLETSIEATGELAYQSVFDGFSTELDSIKVWAQGYIEQANQEEQQIVMDGFLAELKVVFDKYTAKIEIGSTTGGYGESWGGGASVGVKLSATFEGTTATKEINKSVIIGTDLI